MKKVLMTILTLLILSVIGLWIYSANYQANHRVFPNTSDITWNVPDLDHDITVYNTTQICDEKKTGFDVEVGPTGWPVGVNQEWEVALYEDDECYYARLIYHEFMLWFTFDDPYIVCKIPKCNVNGNLTTDSKLRYQVLWDITYTTLRTYNYKPYMPNAMVRKINGHTVSFGNYACHYEKYFVICDANYAW